MSRSIDPMDWQNRDQRLSATPVIIVSMSLQPAIPRQFGLHQSPPPLRQLPPMLRKVAVGVNHHLMRGGEFSTGDLGNFHPALTIDALSLIHISEPTRLGMISYAVFCLKKKK